MIPAELVLKQQELTEILSKDPHFESLEPQKVGKNWLFEVYTNKEELRPSTYFKGIPVVFKKLKLSKRFIP